MLTVGFAGLPSAGKSTMINALVGKRVLESGVCRTTTEVCVVGAKRIQGINAKFVQADMRSDDGVEFCALDLPGVCDAEDETGSFDSVTLELIAKCDVVVWVADARTAFLTNHEVAAFGRVRMELQGLSDEGALCQLVVVLSKYEAPRERTRRPIELLDGEIGAETEDSTVEHNVERATGMLDDARVVKFSAFDRIIRSGSEALRALVPRTHAAEEEEGFESFELKWAAENLTEKRLALISRVLRDTKRRAVAAEKSVRVLMSRVAPSPAYDKPFEFLFVRHAVGPRGEVISETTVFSLPVMMDGAVDDELVGGIGGGTLYVRPGFMQFGHKMVSTARMGQLVAPLVRPVYGDVFVVPLSATYKGGESCAIVQSCYKEYWGVCTDDAGVNAKYVLKVGEASPVHLHALVALAPQGLNVRCIKK